LGIKEWGHEILEQLTPLCTLLDGEDPQRPYSHSLATQRAALDDPDRTPSARVLGEMRANGESFFSFAKRLSEAHRASFLAHPLPKTTESAMQSEAEASLREQTAIEASDTLSFEDYLHRYFSQT
jgi:glutamate--cysteine ligase